MSKQGPRSASNRSGPRALFFNWTDRNILVLASLPAMIVMVGVTAIPFVTSIGLAFTDFNAFASDKWKFIGFDNYAKLLADPRIPKVLWNTVYMVGGILITEVVGGLILAVLLRSRIRGIGLIRTLYLVPVMTAPLAAALVWRAMLSPLAGWVNFILKNLGLPQPLWYADPVQAMPTVILSDMWTGAPFIAILCLAGLLAVPEEHIEAARVDGASAWQVFWNIELPAIQPLLILAVIYRAVASFKKFEGVFLLTGGGPGDATQVINLEVYTIAFGTAKFGFAAAVATLGILLVLVMLGGIYLLLRRARQ